MPDRGILVLDVGLSAVKACLFTFDGRVLAEAREPLLTRSPRPGWYVQDPEEWWRLAVDAVRQVRVAAPAWTVEGIGVTGHMHAPVLVDGAERRDRVPCGLGSTPGGRVDRVGGGVRYPC